MHGKHFNSVYRIIKLVRRPNWELFVLELKCGVVNFHSRIITFQSPESKQFVRSDSRRECSTFWSIFFATESLYSETLHIKIESHHHVSLFHKYWRRLTYVTAKMFSFSFLNINLLSMNMKMGYHLRHGWQREQNSIEKKHVRLRKEFSLRATWMLATRILHNVELYILNSFTELHFERVFRNFCRFFFQNSTFLLRVEE